MAFFFPYWFLGKITDTESQAKHLVKKMKILVNQLFWCFETTVTKKVSN